MAKKRGAFTQGKTHYNIPHALQMGYFAPRPPPTEPKFGGFVKALQQFFNSGANFNPQLKEGGAKYRDYDTGMHKQMWNSMFGDGGWAHGNSVPVDAPADKPPPPAYQGGGFGAAASNGGIFTAPRPTTTPAQTPPVASQPPPSASNAPPANNGAFGAGLGPMGSGIGMRSPHGWGGGTGMRRPGGGQGPGAFGGGRRWGRRGGGGPAPASS